jgi:hypothetical protein
LTKDIPTKVSGVYGVRRGDIQKSKSTLQPIEKSGNDSVTEGKAAPRDSN